MSERQAGNPIPKIAMDKLIATRAPELVSAERSGAGGFYCGDCEDLVLSHF